MNDGVLEQFLYPKLARLVGVHSTIELWWLMNGGVLEQFLYPELADHALYH